MTAVTLMFVSFLACDLSVPPDRSLDSADTGERESEEGNVDEDGSETASEDTATPSDVPRDTGTEQTAPVDSCEASDLQRTVSLRSPSGEAIAGSITQNDAVKVWAVIENPCNNPVAYPTPNRCLVSSWRMTDSSMAEVANGTFPCLGRPSTYTVEPESSLEQEVAPLHGLPVGTFAVEVTWGGGETSDTTLNVTE